MRSIPRPWEPKNEERMHDAGAGVWFHNETNARVLVIAQLYPAVSLTMYDSNGKPSKITVDDLERNYHRLRV